MARITPKVKAALESKLRFEANPQGVGDAQFAELIAYHDRVLRAYEDDVTGAPNTLRDTAVLLRSEAAIPDRVRQEAVQDVAVTGYHWTGPAYETLRATVNTLGTTIATGSGLLNRGGDGLDRAATTLEDAAPRVAGIRQSFLLRAEELARQAVTTAAAVRDDIKANIYRWQMFSAINELGLKATRDADAVMVQADSGLRAARDLLAAVVTDAGGDTHNPAVARPAGPAPGQDPVARLAYRNGYEDGFQTPNAEVRQLQQLLQQQGLLPSGADTGRWAADTQRAVDTYLRNHNLPPFDPALADPSRLPPRFEGVWPIVERASRQHGIDPVYVLAMLDREHNGGAPVGRPLPDRLVGQGGKNDYGDSVTYGGIRHSHGHGLPQIDDRTPQHVTSVLEPHAQGMNPEVSIPYAVRLIQDNLRLSNGNMHQAMNRYNGGGPQEPVLSGRNYGIDVMSRARLFRTWLYGLDRAEPTAQRPLPAPKPAAQGPVQGFTASRAVLTRLSGDLTGHSATATRLVSRVRQLRLSSLMFGSRRSSEEACDAFHRATAAIANRIDHAARALAEKAAAITDSANGYRGEDELISNEILGLKPRTGLPGSR